MNMRMLAGGLLLVVLGSLACIYAQSNADIYRQAAANERNAAAQCPEPGRSCHLRMAGYYGCVVEEVNACLKKCVLVTEPFAEKVIRIPYRSTEIIRGVVHE
jgi:hypothetical protein